MKKLIRLMSDEHIALIFVGGIVLSFMLVVTNLYASSWDASSNQQGPVPDSSVFAAKSTAAVVGNAMLVFSGKGILYGVHPGTVTTVTSQVIVFRDSNTANATDDNIMTTVLMPTISSNTFAPPVMFNPPLRVYNGLSVDASACPTLLPGQGKCYSVIYDTLP